MPMAHRQFYRCVGGENAFLLLCGHYNGSGQGISSTIVDKEYATFVGVQATGAGRPQLFSNGDAPINRLIAKSVPEARWLAVRRNIT